MYTDLRLKIIRFFRKYKKIIFIVICIWFIVFMINKALKGYKPKKELQTTYTPHTSVMDNKKGVSKKNSNKIEKTLEEYMNYCFDGNIESAYGMLSDTCKEVIFDNSLDEFALYVNKKAGGSKKYAIQDFSNEGNTYIYQIKYTEDYLATGITNSTYNYAEEKIIFKKQKDGTFEMAVGSFVDFDDIKNISENEYLKVDVKSVIKYYQFEEYIVKLTNRSEYTIVVSDNRMDNEIFLQLGSGERRNRLDIENNIVLKPGETRDLRLDFSKFYDNDDDTENITFGAIRVMENYSGIDVEDEIIQSEIQNAISKFSVTIPVK